MFVGDVHNAALGFAIFDAWLRAVESSHHSRHSRACRRSEEVESPLIDAAFQAFNAYAKTVEAANAAQIAALAPQVIGYTQTPNGGVATTQMLAPFYALSVMA